MWTQPTQGQELRLGLGAEVLPPVRPVAQDVVNVGRDMGGHLRQELGGEEAGREGEQERQLRSRARPPVVHGFTHVRSPQ